MAFQIIMLINALYASVVLVTPSGFYSSVFTLYLFTVGAACLLGIYVSIKAVNTPEERVCFLFCRNTAADVRGADRQSSFYTGHPDQVYSLGVFVRFYPDSGHIAGPKRYSDAFPNVLSVYLTICRLPLIKS